MVKKKLIISKGEAKGKRNDNDDVDDTDVAKIKTLPIGARMRLMAAEKKHKKVREGAY